MRIARQHKENSLNTTLPATEPLSVLHPGEHAVFLRMHGEKGVTCRLTSLGFTPGVEIEMIQNYGHGPLLVMVRGTRVALGRQEAKNAFIQRSQA
jgi:ferrous iron transport protein A